MIFIGQVNVTRKDINQEITLYILASNGKSTKSPYRGFGLWNFDDEIETHNAHISIVDTCKEVCKLIQVLDKGASYYPG